MLVYKTERYEDWIETEASYDLAKYTIRCMFHGPWRDPVGEHMCFALWNVEQIPFCVSHEYI